MKLQATPYKQQTIAEASTQTAENLKLYWKGPSRAWSIRYDRHSDYQILWLLWRLLSPCQVIVAQIHPTLWPHALKPARFLCPSNAPAKNTGVGCQALLQEIFPTHGSNLGLLHFRQILYHLSHQRSPKVKVLVAQSCPTLQPMDIKAAG